MYVSINRFLAVPIVTRARQIVHGARLVQCCENLISDSSPMVTQVIGIRSCNGTHDTPP